MHSKKWMGGLLAVGLLVSVGYASQQEGGMLQGKFSVKTSTPAVTTKAKPDFYFSGGVNYDSGNNYFKTTVCQTNVTSADVKQTSLKFSVARGQSVTVQFTPTETTSESCQSVSSGDLLSKLLIAQSGSYDVTATLDSTSVQTEVDEKNNSVTTSGVTTESDYYLYDSDQLPDLTVEDMYFEIDDSESSPRYNVFSMVCGLSDLKEYPSENEVTTTYSLLQNGVQIESETHASANFFSASDDCGYYGFTMSPSKAALLSTGEVTMYTQLDTKENVPESNEDNNGWGQAFTDEIVIEQ